MKCDRCGWDGPGRWWTMSWFNTDNICSECAVRERSHPLLEVAVRADCEAVARGDLNFKGIGKPVDL